MRRQRRRKRNRPRQTYRPGQGQDRRYSGVNVVIALGIDHEDVDAVAVDAARTSTASRPACHDLASDDRHPPATLPRQHVGNGRYRHPAPSGSRGELGGREQLIAEPLAPVARHPPGGGNGRQDESRSVERVERSVDLGTEMTAERRIDLLQDHRRTRRARSASRTRAYAARGSSDRLWVLTMTIPSSSRPRTAARIDGDPHPPPRCGELGGDVARAGQIVRDRGECRHRINTARAGAPSTCSSLSGRHDSRYGPGRDLAQVETLDDENTRARAGSLWTSKVLLPNCSIER